ncbi:MAG: hypothetical protein ACRYG8_44440 [Janthinobacterium lividum]
MTAAAAIKVPRLCPRCGKPFVKAGRIVDGEAVCQSCGNATRPAVTCVACGRPTKRPARSEAHGGLICEPCARRATHATCRTCRRHRPIARCDGDGLPLCAACAADQPTTHPCPDCKRTVPGDGLAPCPPCGLRRRTMKAAHEAAADLRQAWARELLVTFHASLDYERMPGDMARRVAKAASFVATLDHALPSPDGITQATLLDLHGADGLRRQERIVAFLVARLAIPWDGHAGIAHSAREAARKALDGSGGRGWHHDLAAFSEALAASAKPLSDRSIKAYVGAARDLLDGAKVERADQLTQRQLNAWLRHRSGRTNDVLRFLGWLGGNGGPGLSVRPRPKTTARTRERAVLQASKELLTRLTLCQDPREGRALLARAIAAVHGLRLERVLAIQQRDVEGVPERIDLRVEETSIALGPTLSAAFSRFANDTDDLPFAGRARIAPLSAVSTNYHIHREPGKERATVTETPDQPALRLATLFANPEPGTAITDG